MMMKHPDLNYKGNRISPIYMLILVSVRKEKKYGYEIIKDLRDHAGNAWNPQTGVIYPAIKKLCEMGLLESESIDDKEHYFLSEDGKEWMQRSMPMLSGMASFIMGFATSIMGVCEEMGVEACELPDVHSMSKNDRLKMLMETRETVERDLLKINKMIEKIAGESEWTA